MGVGGTVATPLEKASERERELLPEEGSAAPASLGALVQASIPARRDVKAEAEQSRAAGA